MKNAKKLNLSNLKVESFVTSLEGKDSQTVKGGSSHGCFLGSLVIAAFASITINAAMGAAATAHKHC